MLDATNSSTMNILAAGSLNKTTASQLRKSLVGGPAFTINEEPNLPRRFYEEPSKQVKKDEVKGTQWYDEYFALEEKIERMQEENEKMKREIKRRTERYNNNEKEYRQEINELERELRVRKGLEENANKTNR